MSKWIDLGGGRACILMGDYGYQIRETNGYCGPSSVMLTVEQLERIPHVAKLIAALQVYADKANWYEHEIVGFVWSRVSAVHPRVVAAAVLEGGDVQCRMVGNATKAGT